MSEQIFNGDHYADSYNGSGAGLVGITRAAIAAGTPNNVVINDGAGLLSSAATLSTALGGLGVNSSAFSGVAKVAAGVWSASTIVNADIAAGAAITRNKLAAGSPNYVVINGISGAMAEEQFLGVSRGGTGADLSAVVGPAVLSISAGVIGSIGYSTSATPSTIVQRDGSGNISASSLLASTINVSTITAAGDITINPAGGDVFLTTTLLHQIPSGIAGGDSYTAVGNVETVGAVSAVIGQIITSPNRVYGLSVNAACGNIATGQAGHFTFVLRAKNIGGTLTINSVLQKMVSIEAGISSVDVIAQGSGAAVQIVAVGQVGATIRWVCSINCVEQSLA